MRKNNITIWQQVLTMNRIWPNFRVLLRRNNFVHWEGTLCPLNRVYTVHVFLCRMRSHNKSFQTLSRVISIEPILHRRTEAPDTPIPHIYNDQNDLKHPYLCLYDPRESVWNSSTLVANTIIPWTIDWLACYEGWLATGEWTGGGRHPAARESNSNMNNALAQSNPEVLY